MPILPFCPRPNVLAFHSGPVFCQPFSCVFLFRHPGKGSHAWSRGKLEGPLSLSTDQGLPRQDCTRQVSSEKTPDLGKSKAPPPRGGDSVGLEKSVF